MHHLYECIGWIGNNLVFISISFSQRTKKKLCMKIVFNVVSDGCESAVSMPQPQLTFGMAKETIRNVPTIIIVFVAISTHTHTLSVAHTRSMGLRCCAIRWFVCLFVVIYRLLSHRYYLIGWLCKRFAYFISFLFELRFYCHNFGIKKNYTLPQMQIEFYMWIFLVTSNKLTQMVQSPANWSLLVCAMMKEVWFEWLLKSSDHDHFVESKLNRNSWIFLVQPINITMWYITKTFNEYFIGKYSIFA